ncbi:MAG: tetratricopeptide repeat protein, partial [Deltaproteobacteria bacterium]|nr:tetratricopeptide repeat protein [Deltaproteobacteria bacterium]
MSTMPVRCGAMLLGVLLAGGPVRAQVEDPVEQARELFEEGNAAARAQEYDRALELFHRSYLLNPNPTVTFNIGLCYQKMGDAPAAVQAFVDYLEEGGDALPEERRSRTQELIDGLAPQV